MHEPTANKQEGITRVKVYRLSSTGQWEDKGTGHISVEYMEQADAMGLIVIAESDSSKTLLVHKLVDKDIYNRSGEATIITWHDTEVRSDVAISFQTVAGCNTIWDQIKAVQKEEQERHLSGQRRNCVDEYDQAAGHGEDGDGMGYDLPAPEMANLDELAKILSHVTPFQRERIATQLMKPNYLPSLLDLFKVCEDLEDADCLKHLFVIVRSAIMLNDASVLEEMLREDHVMDVVGALEYDPDIKAQQKHRTFLQSHVQFKEVVPITSPEILAKIHQTYRIQYLKDVILPRSLDDATYATLSSLALFNNVEVVSALQHDPAFLPELFRKLNSHSPADPEWHDLVAFLQDLCGLAKHLQQAQRQQLFNKLVQLRMFDVVTRIMQHGNHSAKLRATDILMSAMQHDVLALRTYLIQKDVGPDGQEHLGHTLFSLLVSELLEGTDGGLPEQIAELLKVLLDPETMEQKADKDEFLDCFYDKFVDRLLAVVLADRQSSSKEGTRDVPAHTLGIILDLLCFCVQYHSFRIKYYTLRNNLVEKVLHVVRRRERWLVCAAIRFLRVCVGMKDDFFNRYLLRNNTFDPVMNVFSENGSRYNLINSTVLDLVDFIRRENIRPLLEYLVENYYHKFEDVDYVDTFKQLKLKYDQGKERGEDGSAAAAGQGGPGGPAGGGGGGANIRGRTFVFNVGEAAGSLLPQRRRRDNRDLEKDEEDYFSEDMDGDDGARRGGAPGGHSNDADSPTQSPQQQQQQQPDRDPFGTAGAGPRRGPGGGSGSSPGRSRPGGASANSHAWHGGLVDYDDDDEAPEEGPHPLQPQVRQQHVAQQQQQRPAQHQHDNAAPSGVPGGTSSGSESMSGSSDDDADGPGAGLGSQGTRTGDHRKRLKISFASTGFNAHTHAPGANNSSGGAGGAGSVQWQEQSVQPVQHQVHGASDT